jgi:hypothetical protein
LPPGKYEVSFKLKITNATDRYIVTLNVAEDSGVKNLVNAVVFGSDFAEPGVWQYFTVRFQLDKLTPNVEFRGLAVSNASDVYLDYISLTQTDGYNNDLYVFSSYSELFTSQQLPNMGTVANDTLSFSDKVLLHKTTDSHYDLWFGPYVSLSSGTYEVKFRLKIANTTDKYVITLDVTQDFGNKTLTNRQLFGMAFSEVNVWQCFTLRFRLDKSANGVEFRGIHVSNATDVYFDFLSVSLISIP